MADEEGTKGSVVRGEEELKLGLGAYEFIVSLVSTLGWMIESLES